MSIPFCGWRARLTVLAILVVGSIVPTAASAQLLVSPLRLTFEGRQRSAVLTLSNTDKVPRSYRLSWVEQVMTPEGGLRQLSQEEIAGRRIASPMLAFSPRQITINPGEQQTVRVALRRPPDLSDGEYRSHLMFEALPPPAPAGARGQVKVNVVVSLTIPVIVRQGRVVTTARIDQAGLRRADDGSLLMDVVVGRQGNGSSIGAMDIIFRPDGGRDQAIGQLNNVAIYPEVDRRRFSVPLTGALAGPGALSILYRGAGDAVTLARQDFRIQ
jgi:P pilus assembly chaperone PapD